MRIHRTLRYINTIIQSYSTSHSGTSRHNKRGWISAGGEVLHSVFGTARNKDIENIKHTVESVRKQNVNLVCAWSEAIEQLSSFTVATNTRLDNMRDMTETQQKALQ